MHPCKLFVNFNIKHHCFRDDSQSICAIYYCTSSVDCFWYFLPITLQLYLSKWHNSFELWQTVLFPKKSQFFWNTRWASLQYIMKCNSPHAYGLLHCPYSCHCNTQLISNVATLHLFASRMKTILYLQLLFGYNSASILSTASSATSHK